MNFYVERPPIPERVVHEITAQGRLGQELREMRKAPEAVIRDVEVGVIMTIETANSLVMWLKTKIDEHDKIKKESGKRKS